MGSDAGGVSGAQQSASGRNNENRVLATLGASVSRDRRLTPTHRAAMELLLRGASDADVGEQLGVDRGTVYRWRTAHPVFRAELERLRKVLWRQQADRLRAMVSPALDVLQQQLSDPKTALRAASTLLRYAAPRAGDPEPGRVSEDERRQIARREFDRALDAFIHGPAPAGTRSAEVHCGPEDDDDEGEDNGDE